MEQHDILEALVRATTYPKPARKDWRIGCVGAGFIMADCHLVSYLNAGFNPVAIASRTEAHAASVANTHATTAAAPNVSSTGLGTGAGMMPMAGARAGNDEHRSNQSYFVDAVNRTDVVGDLGTVVSPVIGADISEENNGVTEA